MRSKFPSGSVIHDGDRILVFVDVGMGCYDPWEIILGVRSDGGYFEVKSRLKNDGQVVILGQFMLDSSSILREPALRRHRAREKKKAMEMNLE